AERPQRPDPSIATQSAPGEIVLVRSGIGNAPDRLLISHGSPLMVVWSRPPQLRANEYKTRPMTLGQSRHTTWTLLQCKLAAGAPDRYPLFRWARRLSRGSGPARSGASTGNSARPTTGRP